MCAHDVLSRLTDPSLLDHAIENTYSTTGHPDDMVWRGEATTFGPAGIAMACAAAHRVWPDEAWLQRGHELLGYAAKASRAKPSSPPGVGRGLAGLGSAAELMRVGQSRYAAFQGGIDRQIAHRLPSMLANHEYYDLMGGVTGVAAYLSMRTAAGNARDELTAILQVLAHRLQSHAQILKWFRVSANTEPVGRAEPAVEFIDCGLAHGVMGPIALLAILSRSATSPEDGAAMRDAVAAGVEWVLECGRTDASSYEIPRIIAIDSSLNLTPQRATRPGWCYGAAGFGRALYLCAAALRSRALAIQAVELLTAAMADLQLTLASPTICHGYAGLLLSVAVTARDSRDPDLNFAAEELTWQLLEKSDRTHLLMFRDVENGGAEVDNPGLLSGAAGIALSLLTVATGRTDWLRLLLLD